MTRWVVTPKFAETMPAAIVTTGGRLTNVDRLELSSMDAPPAGAGRLRLTVQVVVESGGVIVPQVRLLSCVVDARLTVVVRVTCPALAVIVTVTLLKLEPAEIGNVADVDPAAIVATDGTSRLVLSLLSETLKPPAGAALVRFTVQIVEPFGARLEAEHEMADS